MYTRFIIGILVVLFVTSCTIVDNSVPIQGTGVLLNSSTQPQAIQSKSLANPPMQSITGSMDDVTKDKASPIMTADLINERDTFLELAAQKGNKIQCDTFQTLYVVQLCNDYLKDIDHYAKQNIVSLDEGISLSPEDKKRLNASFEKGDISACGKTYTQSGKILDCQIGLILHNHMSCSIATDVSIVNKCEGIKKQLDERQHILDLEETYKKYGHYLHK